MQKTAHAILQNRFIGFSLVGGLVAGLHFIMLAVLVEVFHLQAVPAGLITTAVALQINFLLNKRLNWRDRSGSVWAQWLRFHAARAMTVAINQALFAALVSLSIHYLLAGAIGAAVGWALNYLGSDRFVFRPALKKNDPSLKR